MECARVCVCSACMCAAPPGSHQFEWLARSRAHVQCLCVRVSVFLWSAVLVIQVSSGLFPLHVAARALVVCISSV